MLFHLRDRRVNKNSFWTLSIQRVFICIYFRFIAYVSCFMRSRIFTEQQNGWMDVGRFVCGEEIEAYTNKRICSHGSAARSELERRRAHRPRGAETNTTVRDIDHITEAWVFVPIHGEGGEEEHTGGGECRVATTSQTFAFGLTFCKRIITFE